MLQFLADNGLSPTAFLLYGVLILLLGIKTWINRSRVISSILIVVGLTAAAVPSVVGIPVALTNAALLKLPASALVPMPFARMGVNTIGDAPVSWWWRQNGTCSISDIWICQNSTYPGDGNSFVNVASGIYNNAILTASPTVPTIASGGCTTGSAQTISASNGTAAFAITLGGATCGNTIVLTFPTAAHGWACDANDVTTPATNAISQTVGGSTTSVTLTNFVRTTGVAGNFTAADVLVAKCLAY